MNKWIVGVLLVAIAVAAYAVDSATVSPVGNGFYKVEWVWSANSSGAASATTNQEVYGGLSQLTWVPDSTTPIGTNNTTTLTVKYNYIHEGTTHNSVDLMGGAATCAQSTLKSVDEEGAGIELAGPLLLNITGATTANNNPASGKIIMVVGGKVYKP